MKKTGLATRKLALYIILKSSGGEVHNDERTFIDVRHNDNCPLQSSPWLV